MLNFNVEKCLRSPKGQSFKLIEVEEFFFFYFMYMQCFVVCV